VNPLMTQNIRSLPYFIPEAILLGTLLLVLVCDLLQVKGKKTLATLPVTVTGLVACFAVSLNFGMNGDTASGLFHGMITLDPFALFFKYVFLGSTLFVVLMSRMGSDIDRKAHAEYHTILIAITLGLMLMAASTNLLMVYLSLEFVSILSYVAAGMQPRERRSREAALKYVLYGGAASAFMLYGMSLIYGMTGTTDIYLIRDTFIANSSYNFTLLFSVALILAGFGYKIAAAPFHMWAPDVYEGSPTAVTAFFSVAPKAAGFAVLIRVFGTWFSGVGDMGGFGESFTHLVGVMAIATMVVGNFGAMLQSNIKRFLAYSSIAHAGYLLMGIAMLPNFAEPGFRAILLYVIFYVFMNFGAFFVGALVMESTDSEDISAFRGLGKRNLMAAIVMAIFMFSLAGLPPLAGFIGKFYLFAAVIQQLTFFTLLMITVAIITSVVAAFYYFRIVRAMFLDPSTDTEPQPTSRLAQVMLTILVIPTVVFGVYWTPVIKVVDKGLVTHAPHVYETQTANTDTDQKESPVADLKTP